MKNSGLFYLLLACIGLASCKNNQKDDKAAQGEAEKPISVACYKALYEKDTIELKVNTLKTGKITGTMVMNLAKMPVKKGKIVGEFRGDTLFAAYTFTEGSNDEVTFKNPMAFLRQGNALILGNGKIETTMGGSYFIKGEPIDFDRVKYKFSTVPCLDK